MNALAAAPSHNRVFSAGSDGQVCYITPITEVCKYLVKSFIFIALAIYIK